MLQAIRLQRGRKADCAYDLLFGHYAHVAIAPLERGGARAHGRANAIVICVRNPCTHGAAQ